MYFWKIENLKEDIKTKRLTEKDRFIYMFISLIITSFMVFTPILMMSILNLIPPKGMNMWGVMGNLLDMFIIIFGTFLAFRANGGAIGVDFLGKYFSISFVVGLRFTLFYILVCIIITILMIISAIILYIFLSMTEIEAIKAIKELEEMIPLLSVLVAYSWKTAMYWRIIKHIKDVKEIQ